MKKVTWLSMRACEPSKCEHCIQLTHEVERLEIENERLRRKVDGLTDYVARKMDEIHEYLDPRKD